MLPFLKPKKAGTVMVSEYSDGKMMSKGEKDEIDPGVMAAAEDLISAVHMKDAKSVAMALMDAFQMMEMMPHEEVDHAVDEG